MEQLFPALEKLVEVITAIQTGVLFAASIIILIYYSKHRNMRHIAFVSLSYMIMTALVASAVVFKVFYEGPGRLVSIFFALLAFGLGDYALWHVWAKRRVVQEYEELKVLDNLAHTNEARINTVEAELKIFREMPIEVKLIDPSEVKLVDSEDEINKLK